MLPYHFIPTVTACRVHLFPAHGVVGLGLICFHVMPPMEVEACGGLSSAIAVLAVSGSCPECTEARKAPASLIQVFFPSPPLF